MRQRQGRQTLCGRRLCKRTYQILQPLKLSLAHAQHLAHLGSSISRRIRPGESLPRHPLRLEGHRPCTSDSTSQFQSLWGPDGTSVSHSVLLCGGPSGVIRPPHWLCSPHFPRRDEGRTSPVALPASWGQLAANTPPLHPPPQLLLLQERAEDTDSKYRHIPSPPAQLILARLWNPLIALFPFFLAVLVGILLLTVRQAEPAKAWGPH